MVEEVTVLAWRESGAEVLSARTSQLLVLGHLTVLSRAGAFQRHRLGHFLGVSLPIGSVGRGYDLWVPELLFKLQTSNSLLIFVNLEISCFKVPCAKTDVLRWAP